VIKLRLSALIVEDDSSVRETLQEFFIEKGFTVNTARDGVEALGFLNRGKLYDIVLTDLRLPAGDGVEVMRASRQQNPLGYVVLITGFATLESAIEAVRLGAFDYLVKPFALSELELTLNRILEHNELVRRNRRLRGKLSRVKPLQTLIKQQEAIRRAIEQLSEELKLQRRQVESLLEARELALARPER
jgi:DNA-binding NtrC family response regulator